MFRLTHVGSRVLVYLWFAVIYSSACNSVADVSTDASTTGFAVARMALKSMIPASLALRVWSAWPEWLSITSSGKLS